MKRKIKWLRYTPVLLFFEDIESCGGNSEKGQIDGDVDLGGFTYHSNYGNKVHGKSCSLF